MFCLPRHEIHFCDVFIADIFTSYAKVFADLEILICFTWNSCDPLMDRCFSPWISILLISYYLAHFRIPFVLRLKQCLILYNASRKRIHLLNAAKYFSSFPVIYYSFAYHSDPTDYGLFRLWFTNY